MKHVSPSPGSRSLRWFLASRPKTLGISLAPVVVASALAYREQGLWSMTTMLVSLFAAVAIQIGTNLYNDAADFERGAD
ncbi:MAG: prenyltransferase, partial [Gammaproteobacteria bacterium]|nr:prenyltransferase [Gammaproteobacteria bacterium]